MTERREHRAPRASRESRASRASGRQPTSRPQTPASTSSRPYSTRRTCARCRWTSAQSTGTTTTHCDCTRCRTCWSWQTASTSTSGPTAGCARSIRAISPPTALSSSIILRDRAEKENRRRSSSADVTQRNEAERTGVYPLANCFRCPLFFFVRLLPRSIAILSSAHFNNFL